MAALRHAFTVADRPLLAGPVQPFGLWGIRVTEIMEFESPPGLELAPRHKPAEMWGSHFFAGA